MNPSTRNSVARALRQLETGLFTDQEIRLILIGLRQDIRPGIIRELADFVAHGDKRDRGISHKEVVEAFDCIRCFHLQRLGRPIEGRTAFEIKPAFTGKEIIDKLFDTLEQLGFLTKEHRQSLLAQRDGIIIACIVMMQGVKFKYKSSLIPAYLLIYPPQRDLWLSPMLQLSNLNIPDVQDDFIDFTTPLVTAGVNLSKVELIIHRTSNLHRSTFVMERNNSGKIVLRQR